MSQLSIFDVQPQGSSGKLPVAIIPLEPKAEAAIAALEEIAKLRIDSELVEGCTVRSDLFFKGQTGIIKSLYAVGWVQFANVELEVKGNLITFPCGTKSLEVVT